MAWALVNATGEEGGKMAGHFSDVQNRLCVKDDGFRGLSQDGCALGQRA